MQAILGIMDLGIVIDTELELQRVSTWGAVLSMMTILYGWVTIKDLLIDLVLDIISHHKDAVFIKENKYGGRIYQTTR
jgi:hypothetical protein